MEDVPTGTYTTNEPYATTQVHFRKTADLNNDGNVDMVDVMLQSQNWLNNKDNGEYLLGDITGDNGMPDGKVDMNDFAEMASQFDGGN